jgi:aspartate/methionine/tyrosine aminotransferase
LKALGYEAVVLEADPADHLQLTPALLEQAGGFDGALVASPANPTGAMLSREALGDLCAAMRAAGKPLISDEIYHGLTYGVAATTALASDNDVIVVNSFSKYWAMTGWRVGWIVAPPRLVKSIEKLAQNLTVAPPTVSQVAALGALEAKQECEARRALYADNRALLLGELAHLRMPPVVEPDGAFYMLVDVSAWGDDSMALSHRLLSEAGVAVTPGIDFCATRGRHWARLAYCRPRAEIEEGIARLSRLI